MIKDYEIEILISRNDMKEYYESKGYKINKVGEKIKINAKDISPSSHKDIEYICDYCGKIFTRKPYSACRSKKQNKKDACIKCSRKSRTKETCQIQYGVNNPIQVNEFQKKCAESKNNNNNSNNKETNQKACSKISNGIPVSKAQYSLYQILENFQLNYYYQGYYLDLVKDNIAIEYDGHGHDLQVKLGYISRDDFEKREQYKQELFLKKFRLLRIKDLKDKFRNEKNIYNYIEEIKQFIESDELYKEIIVN